MLKGAQMETGRLKKRIEKLEAEKLALTKLVEELGRDNMEADD